MKFAPTLFLGQKSPTYYLNCHECFGMIVVLFSVCQVFWKWCRFYGILWIPSMPMFLVKSCYIYHEYITMNVQLDPDSTHEIVSSVWCPYLGLWHELMHYDYTEQTSSEPCIAGDSYCAPAVQILIGRAFLIHDIHRAEIYTYHISTPRNCTDFSAVASQIYTPRHTPRWNLQHIKFLRYDIFRTEIYNTLNFGATTSAAPKYETPKILRHDLSCYKLIGLISSPRRPPLRNFRSVHFYAEWAKFRCLFTMVHWWHDKSMLICQRVSDIVTTDMYVCVCVHARSRAYVYVCGYVCCAHTCMHACMYYECMDARIYMYIVYV